MKKQTTLYFRRFILTILLFYSFITLAQAQNPEELANAISYGIPVSPAFELLPGKPSEVSNILTPKDVFSTVPTFVSNGKIKTGMSANIRPVSLFLKSSLQQYQQKSWLGKAIWRTVLAIGTASDPDNNDDAFLSTGLRIPLVDKGDPRADSCYASRLSEVYANALGALVQPGFEDEISVARKKIASAAAEKERQKLSKEAWKKPKVDLGLAYMLRAKNSSYRPDDLKGNRWGGWAAAAFGLGKITQINISGKATKITQVENNDSETGRYVLGSRARFFICDKFALSAEAAQLWSAYSKNTSLNESWTHFAIIAEANVPVLGGWLTLAYGGDSKHRTATDSKFSFSYAVSTDRIMKKN